MQISFKVDAPLIVVTSLAGLLVVFAIHATYPSLFGFWPSTSQDLAAWLQALGSIAAVIGTWWATKHQIEAAEIGRRSLVLERDLDLSRATLKVSTKVHRRFRYFHSLITEGANQYHVIGDSEIKSMISTIDLILLQNPTGTSLNILIDARLRFDELLLMDNKNTDEYRRFFQILKIQKDSSRHRWTLRCHVRSLAAKIQ